MASEFSKRQSEPEFLSSSFLGKSESEYGVADKVLGAGGYGMVVRHRKGDRKYAVKTLHRKDSIDKTYLTMLSEIVYPMSLSHPNIVECVDFFTHDFTQIKIVMPFAKYDLHGLIARSYFVDNIPAIKDACAQLIAGMAYLTSRNVLHRDLKPENVLCYRISEGAFQYRIADFGISSSRACISSYKDTGVYTLNYKAPEILYSPNLVMDYNESADVWALGCTLYELIGNGTLFKGRTESEIAEEFARYSRDQTGNYWDKAPPEYQNFITQMVSYFPHNRVDIFTIQYDPFLRDVNRIKTPFVERTECGQRYKKNVAEILKPSSYNLPYSQELIDKGLAIISDADLFGYKFRPEAISLARMMYLYMFLSNPGVKFNITFTALAAAYNAFNFIEDEAYLSHDEISIALKNNEDHVMRVMDYAVRMLESMRFNLLVSTPHDILVSYIKNHELSEELVKISSQILELASFSTTLFLKGDVALRCIAIAQYLLGIREEHDSVFLNSLKMVKVPENQKYVCDDALKLIHE